MCTHLPDIDEKEMQANLKNLYVKLLLRLANIAWNLKTDCNLIMLSICLFLTRSISQKGTCNNILKTGLINSKLLFFINVLDYVLVIFVLAIRPSNSTQYFGPNR